MSVYQVRTVMCISVGEVSKSLYQARTVMCMCIREGSKCLYQARTVIKVITKLPKSEQFYKGKVQTHNYINRQNQSTTGKL